jgi:acyl-CoA-binding protein
MATEEELAQAVQRVNALAKSPGQSDMLELYGLYKQATVGDASGGRPGMFDVKGRAKWDAWATRRGTSKDDARTKYVELARRLGA